MAPDKMDQEKRTDGPSEELRLTRQQVATLQNRVRQLEGERRIQQEKSFALAQTRPQDGTMPLPLGKWRCQNCTYAGNNDDQMKCEMCGDPIPLPEHGPVDTRNMIVCDCGDEFFR